MNAPAPNTKAELLSKTVEHVDITAYDARPVIDAMRKMSFTSRDTARAADILAWRIEDAACSVWLTLAGSTSAGGCMHVYRDMVQFGMIDVVVATGASIIDMDFFEALGFKHYQAAGRRRRPRAARPLHRPHLRHLHRRGRAAGLRPRRSRRSPTRWSRAPIPAASSSTRSAAGWRPATPRSPAA